MENFILIISAIILVIVLAVSIYFLIIKKKNDEINVKTKTTLEEQKTTTIPEKILDNTQKENLEKIIDKNVENNSVVEPTQEVVKTISQSKKEKTVVSKSKENVISENAENQPKLNINISSKTEKVLLKKLEAFEKSKDFIKKDVNLNNLAKQFDTNTKYLSEIIKSYKNKNFNQYLNELRINYLIEQLKTNDKVLNTKVSYLASDFGFNSHSSFSTLFTQYVGQSPSEYIKELKKSKKEKITE